MAFNEMVLRPTNFDQLTTFSQIAAKSSMVPKDYMGKPENIMMAVQMGSELGLAPMQSIQNIAVINGRPAVWGDAMLALVKRHPDFEDAQETIEGEGEQRVAICKVKRRSQTPIIVKFSVHDAKRAGLWAKPGPWQQYPDRMLQMRARGFALRDAFPDALKGLISAEEADDIPRPAQLSSAPIIDGAPDYGNQVATITVPQWRDLADLISETNTDMNKFLRFMGISDLGDLSATDFPKAKGALLRKRAEMANAAAAKEVTEE